MEGGVEAVEVTQELADQIGLMEDETITEAEAKAARWWSFRVFQLGPGQLTKEATILPGDGDRSGEAVPHRER